MHTGKFTVEPDLRELRSVVRKYTEEQKQDMANEASDLNNRVKLVKDEKKAKMADYNGKIKNMEAERDILTDRRQRGFDQEQIMCEGILEERNGVWFMVFYSEDDGTEVDSRHATPSERQTTIQSKAANE